MTGRRNNSAVQLPEDAQIAGKAHYLGSDALRMGTGRRLSEAGNETASNTSSTNTSTTTNTSMTSTTNTTSQLTNTSTTSTTTTSTVTIYDGRSGGPNGGVYRGLPREFKVPRGPVVIEWRTDQFNGYGGWTLEFVRDTWKSGVTEYMNEEAGVFFLNEQTETDENPIATDAQ